MDKKSYNHNSQTHIKRGTSIGKVDNSIEMVWTQKEVYVSKFISSDTQFNYCSNFLSVWKLEKTAEIVLNITPSKK